MKSYAQWSWTITVHEIHTYMKPKSILPWTLIKEKFTISWRPEVSDWHRNWEESGLQTHPQPIQLVPNSYINFAIQIPLSRPASAAFVSWTQIPFIKGHGMNTVHSMTCYDVWKILWSVIMTLWTPVILHDNYEHLSSMISIIPMDLMYDQWS